jgi:hypothetical protein
MSVDADGEKSVMKRDAMQFFYAAVVSLAFAISAPLFAEDTSMPSEPQGKSTAAESVQPQVEEASTDKAAEKRAKITAEAVAAVNETEKALKALKENKPDEALAALEKATGKLELILARDPGLALAPVDVEVVTYDLLASLDTVKAMIDEAEDYLEDGEIQKARPLVENLASEIQIRTTSIPLVTYPDAIKAVTPLIDEGKIDEARAGLQAALSTLVVSTDVMPLPMLRADWLLQDAEALVEKEQRTEDEDRTLGELLQEARNQLKLAALLGYGTQESFDPIYAQLDEIEAKIAGGEGGKGWFDRIKDQVSELL